MKIKKRIRKIFIKIGIFLGILIGLYSVFRNPIVQTFISQKIANHFSQKLKTIVKISGVDVGFIDHIILEDFYIEDQQKNSLLRVSELKVSISDFDLTNQTIDLEDVTIVNPVFHIFADSTNKMNFQFLIDAFADSIPQIDTSASLWKIKCQHFRLQDGKFSFQKGKPNFMEHGINFNDLFFKKINVSVENFKMNGKTISLNLKNFSTDEKSGLNIENLESQILIDTQKISIRKIKLKTKNSQFAAKFFDFRFLGFNSFDNFFTEVFLNINIDTSTRLNIKDLSYFVPDLKLINKDIKIAGKIAGTLNRLFVDSLFFRLSEKTFLAAHLSANGLPEISQTFFEIFVDSLKIDQKDIAKLRNPKDTTQKLLSLPPQLNALGIIELTAKIKGFLNEIYIESTLKTAVGNIYSNLKVKNDSATKLLSMRGNLATGNIALNRILGNEVLENVQFKDTFAILLPQNAEPQIAMKGKIEKLKIFNYVYQNIEFKTDFSKNIFSGNIESFDENLNFLFRGNIDLSEVPKFDFFLDFTKVHLQKLGLINDSAAKFSAWTTVKMQGDNIDNLAGEVLLNLNFFENSQGKIGKHSFFFEAKPSEFISLKSDIFDAEIKGEYDFLSFDKCFKQLIYNYLPTLIENFEEQNFAENKNDFRFEIVLKNLDEIQKLYFPNSYIEKNTKILGHFNAKNQDFSLQFSSKSLNLENHEVKNLEMKIETSKKELTLNLQTPFFALTDVNPLKNLQIKTSVAKDTVHLSIFWDNLKKTSQYSAAIFLNTSFTKNFNSLRTIVDVLPSQTVIADTLWEIPRSQIQIDSTFIRVKNLKLQHENQILNVNGAISEFDDSLQIHFKNLNIHHFNILTKSKGLELKGILSGSNYVSQIYKMPIFAFNDSIINLIINNLELGNFYGISQWQKEKSQIDMHIFLKLRNALENYFDAKGFYSPVDTAIDFFVGVQGFNLKILRPYLDNFLSKFTANLYGNAHLFGKISNLQYDAKMILNRAAFTVNMLQTQYALSEVEKGSDSIHITNNFIAINKLKITALNTKKNSFAVLSGKIEHQNFDNIRLNILLDIKNFLVLDTKKSDTSAFYGKVFIGGNVNLKGTPQDLKIDASIKTEKDTKIFVSLLTASSFSDEIPFIIFTDSVSKKKKEKQNVDLSRFEMNLLLEATSDAEMQFVMNEKLGDIIKIFGAGNLRMEINTDGNFGMYGNYTIEKGDYMFTLQNIMSKKFDIARGGSIKWNGSPMDAVIDFSALYKIPSCPVYDLLLMEMYRDNRVAVECGISVSEKILNPKIQFHAAITDSEESFASQFNNLDEENQMKQFISLLVLHRFQPLPTMSGSNIEQEGSGTNAVSSNAYELLANQISHWLSQISNKIDVGISYREGEKEKQNQLQVALSARLTDRITVSTNLGVGGNESQKQDSVNNSVTMNDINVEVKLNRAGTLKAKAFNRLNNTNNPTVEQSQTTQGVGVFYRKDFDSFSDLVKETWEGMKKLWRFITFRKPKENSQ